MVDLVAQRAVSRGFKEVLLLGTKYTMEHGYYAQKLSRAGLSVHIPSSEDRLTIQAMQRELSRGVVTSQFRTSFQEILGKFQKIDAVITACTELPLVVTPEITSLPILDPMRVQCEEAFKFALEA
jgi:aspartate racemase